MDNIESYYKQLQRLTVQYDKVVEQNKSLQTEIIKIKADNSKLFEKAVEARKETDNTFERLQQKEQECKKLKEYIKQDLAPYSQMLQNQLDRYKQALEKIEEIVNEPCIDTGDCKSCKSNCEHKDILNIINEVKD